MSSDEGLRTLGEVIQGIYKLMTEVMVPVFGYEIPLWLIFLYGFIGGVIVWFIRKIFD